MPDYRALKVKIGRKPNGQALYPDFNTLAAVSAAGVDWSVYVDTNGIGWFYDAKYGHGEEGPDSPTGEQWGVLIVAQTFADQAVIAFPLTCSTLTEQEAQEFVEDRATSKLPDEEVDNQTLSDMGLQIDLIERLDKSGKASVANKSRLAALRTRLDKALDPDDDEPGVRRSQTKTWTALKATKTINIV